MKRPNSRLALWIRDSWLSYSPRPSARTGPSPTPAASGNGRSSPASPARRSRSCGTPPRRGVLPDRLVLGQPAAVQHAPARGSTWAGLSGFSKKSSIRWPSASLTRSSRSLLVAMIAGSSGRSCGSRPGWPGVQPRHHLVQQHQVEAAFFHYGHGFFAGRGGDHRKSLVLEQDDLRSQQFDLVVDPQQLVFFVHIAFNS